MAIPIQPFPDPTQIVGTQQPNSPAQQWSGAGPFNYFYDDKTDSLIKVNPAWGGVDPRFLASNFVGSTKGMNYATGTPTQADLDAYLKQARQTKGQKAIPLGSSIGSALPRYSLGPGGSYTLDPTGPLATNQNPNAPSQRLSTPPSLPQVLQRQKRPAPISPMTQPPRLLSTSSGLPRFQRKY
jgi:hypothetical protein